MTSTIEDRLRELGIELPPPARAVGKYVGFVRTGNQVWSVQGPLVGDDLAHQGRLGEDLTLEQGQAAARQVMLNLLAQVRIACDGDLDRMVRCVRLGGFVNSTAGFRDHTAVMNGASDLAVEILGERGRHTRFAVGCSSLPYDLSVEIEGVFEVSP